jgi:hypothetical protein
MSCHSHSPDSAFFPTKTPGPFAEHDARHSARMSVGYECAIALHTFSILAQISVWHQQQALQAEVDETCLNHDQAAWL